MRPVKINKEMILQISNMEDRELWRTVTGIAAGYGIKLNNEMPPKEELNRLRELLRASDRLSLSDALRIIATYKKKG